MGVVTAPIIRVLDKGGMVYNVKAYGAKGDGVTDDRTAIQAAITAARAASGGEVFFPAGIYAFAQPLFQSVGTVSNIVFRGIPGKSTLLKIATGTTDANMFYALLDNCNNCVFDGLVFDGNYPTTSALTGINLVFPSASNITFVNCDFRRQNTGVYLQAVDTALFDNCRFWGTSTDYMTAGTWDPTPNTAATYRDGVSVTQECRNITFRDCYFHYCRMGLNVPGTATQHAVSGLTVEGCTFRGDWWRQPYIRGTFTPTAYDTTTRRITVAGGGLTGLFTSNNYEVFTCARDILSGTGGLGLAACRVTHATAGFSGVVKVGDVIELADGRRGEIAVITSNTEIQIRGWEAAATFEPTTEPTSTTQQWRIRRYYSTMGIPVSDTQFDLYSEPYNPHDGELLFTHAGLTPVGRVCYAFAKTIYSTTNMSYSKNVRFANNTCRGSWADQISIFDCTGVQIDNNHITLGEDMAITMTRNIRCLVTNNLCEKPGAGTFFASPGLVLIGNTVHNWGQSNRSPVSAAFQIYPGDPASLYGGASVVAIGNVATRDAGTLGGDASYMFYLRGGDATYTWANSVFEANASPGARVGQIYIENADTGAPLTIRDGTYFGPGRANVRGTITAAITWNPPSVANNAQTVVYMDVSGAAIGDAVYAGFSQVLPIGTFLAAWVVTADVVAVALHNNSGVAVDLASGTLTAVVNRNPRLTLTTAVSLATNLSAFYKLDEASGTRNDSIGTAHLTSINGTPTQVAGKIGNAVQIDALFECLRTAGDDAALSIGTTTSFSVCAWYRVDAKTRDNHIVCKGTGGPSSIEYDLFRRTSDDLFVLTLSDGTNLSSLGYTGVNTTVGQWYFIAAGYDATRRVHWISINNGARLEITVPTNFVGIQDGTQQFTVGASSNTGNSAEGVIDAVGIWKRSITPAEVIDLYNNGNGKEPPF